MSQYQFIGADQDYIYIKLTKNDKSLDIKLPNNQDYFETNEDTQISTSPWIENNFDDLWDMNDLDGIKNIKTLLADLAEELLEMV